VIAAHNESAVIARCLDALAPLTEQGSASVIVVANGCTDDTVEIASNRAGVTVLDLPVASKVGALRAADRVASPGPRIYLDADVVLTSRAALAVFDTLTPTHTRRGGEPGADTLAARPPIHFESTRASLPVRLWYRIRGELPSIQQRLWGAGTYALSVEGRSRFDEFPDIVSDDLFIDTLFSTAETAIVDTDPVTVFTPLATADLMRILVRTYRTQGDVTQDSGSGPISSGQRGQLRDVIALLGRRPWLAPAALVYVALISRARLRARSVPASTVWERDNSSRENR
jgi:hypothetical protein